MPVEINGKIYDRPPLAYRSAADRSRGGERTERSGGGGSCIKTLAIGLLGAVLLVGVIGMSTGGIEATGRRVGTGEVCNIESAPKVARWEGLIAQEAQQHGLDPELVAALIFQESGGNPDAYSRSGAVGLMQVMPRDGLAANFVCKNGPCFANRPSMAQLSDPEFNVEYGTKMLGRLVRRNGGNVREALKAYGPMDVGYYYADIVLTIKDRRFSCD